MCGRTGRGTSREQASTPIMALPSPGRAFTGHSACEGDHPHQGREGSAPDVARPGSNRPRSRLRLEDVERSLMVRPEPRVQRKRDGRARVVEYF